MAAGTEGDKLVPPTQQVVKSVSDYKTAAISVKSLCPKAPKAKAKAKAATKPEV